MAPTVYLEQLEYDARLMNQTLKSGKATATMLHLLKKCCHSSKANLYQKNTGCNQNW